ncbi:MAG: hypothetical protein COA49_05300 [Bacteroidetes bacterium]|nr:MAG: hypothetical protein COA49_05300 [Bacteroidota bacterium]
MNLVTLNLISQEIKAKVSDETKISDEKVQIKHTTKWAAMLPGSGQIINKKYWKAPIVVGGLLASGYFIVDNSKQMKVFLENWGYETDDDPNTVSTLTDSNGLLYLESDLEDGAYFYRRNRDLSYLTFFGVYLLQIVDANVDAHMKFFDASEDISFQIIPPVKSGFRRSDIWQVGLTMNIGN